MFGAAPPTTPITSAPDVEPPLAAATRVAPPLGVSPTASGVVADGPPTVRSTSLVGPPVARIVSVSPDINTDDDGAVADVVDVAGVVINVESSPNTVVTDAPGEFVVDKLVPPPESRVVKEEEEELVGDDGD